MKHAFWLLVIAFSASALSGGYLSGRAAVPHFAAVPVHASAPPDVLRSAPQIDERAEDQFADDSAVPEDPSGGDPSGDARLTVVLVNAGHSLALESPFLSLGIPVTLVIDPRAPAAHAVAQLAVRSGARVYVQAHAPLMRAEIQRLHRLFPGAAGAAARLSEAPYGENGVAAVLRGLNWGVLDEYGGADAARRFAHAGIRYAARSITVDDHVQRAYVAFMLQQAVHLARGRTALVMARPFPGTLQAFEDLLMRAPREGVRFVGL